METLSQKIDFVLLFTVENANCNGDPLNGNRPRETFDGYGEVSDVCLKRKIRNRLQDAEEPIFVQSDDRRTDEFDSLHARADGNEELKKLSKGKNTDRDAYAKAACAAWIDVRSFGQVFAFKGKGDDKGVSVGVRGPVTITSAKSISPIDISSIQITKSVNNESTDKGEKDSSTMGMKHRVEFGLYLAKGSINCQLTEKTGFTDADAEKIKQALLTLFEKIALLQGRMAACKFVGCIGGSMLQRHRSILPQRYTTA